jgi:hypothetical protein
METVKVGICELEAADSHGAGGYSWVMVCN